MEEDNRKDNFCAVGLAAVSCQERRVMPAERCPYQKEKDICTRALFTVALSRKTRVRTTSKKNMQLLPREKRVERRAVEVG